MTLRERTEEISIPYRVTLGSPLQGNPRFPYHRVTLGSPTRVTLGSPAIDPDTEDPLQDTLSTDPLSVGGGAGSQASPASQDRGKKLLRGSRGRGRKQAPPAGGGTGWTSSFREGLVSKERSRTPPVGAPRP